MDSKQNPLVTPGGSTSEGKLTIVGVLVSLLLAVWGAVEMFVRSWSETHPESPWGPVIVAAAGLISAALMAAGYSRSRAVVKSNWLVAAIESGAPVVLEALAKSLTPPSKSTPPAGLLPPPAAGTPTSPLIVPEVKLKGPQSHP